MSSAPTLTTTSYAVLGLLAIKPWTTYELAQHMERSLGRLWPRAQSKLYEEPKKLVAVGFARASAETVGRRPRTVYTITSEGRRALARWLDTPGTGPALESEQLLKVFFADHGSKQSTLSALADLGRWAADQTAEHAAVASSYLSGLGPFPQRAAQLALTGRFLADFADMVGRWASWATEVVRGWPDEPSLAAPDWASLEEIARRGKSGRIGSRASGPGQAPSGGPARAAPARSARAAPAKPGRAAPAASGNLAASGIDPAITGEPPEEQSPRPGRPSRTGRVRPVTADQRAGRGTASTKRGGTADRAARQSGVPAVRPRADHEGE